MTTIVLADDHLLVRKSLRLMIEAESNLKVIGEAGDGREAVELVEKLKPDVLLLDLAIPKIHGLDVVRQVTKTSKTRVLILTVHSAEFYVFEALKNGASGYLVKNSTPGELIAGIRQVASDGLVLSPSLRLAELPGKRRLVPTEEDVLHSLTRREKIVLQLAAEGHNNTEIAAQLSLSPRTIESHRASLMRKLRLRSQTDIVRFAIRKNIIPL